MTKHGQNHMKFNVSYIDLRGVQTNCSRENGRRNSVVYIGVDMKMILKCVSKKYLRMKSWFLTSRKGHVLIVGI